MAFVDQTSTYTYKSLLTHQNLDAGAENSKLHNDLLTAVTDFDNNLRFNNAKYLQGEIAAGSTYKKLIGLDASNIVQLGESGTEVRVPADPSNVLGVATKQYVDGVQMFQTQAIASASGGVGGSLATILSLSATTRGIIHAIWFEKTANATAVRVVVTIDGTAVIDDTSPAVAVGDLGAMRGNGKLMDTNSTEDSDAGYLLDLRFNSTLTVQCADAGAGNVVCKVLYSKIP